MFPVCGGFDMVLDLVEVCISIVPKDQGGTAKETEDDMEDGDEPSKKPSSGTAKSFGNTHPSLEKTIHFFAEKQSQVKMKERARQQRRLHSQLVRSTEHLSLAMPMRSITMAVLIEALVTEIGILHMKHNDHGSKNHSQKYKTLQGW